MDGKKDTLSPRDDQKNVLTKTLLSLKAQQFIEATILALLSLSVYLFTIHPLTRAYAPDILLVCVIVIAAINLLYMQRVHKKPVTADSKTFKVLMFTLVIAILLWVGNTGWSVSPFFYLLYLVGISLGFLFSPSVMFSFVLVLIGVLLPNVGNIDTRVDFVTFFSLFLIIPLSYFLRREYLKKIEREKKILILEKEHKAYENKVEEILANKITRVGTELREPINDVKQLALYAKSQKKVFKDEDYDAIIASSEKALNYLKHFEEDTTGRILVKTPKEEK